MGLGVSSCAPETGIQYGQDRKYEKNVGKMRVEKMKVTGSG